MKRSDSKTVYKSTLPIPDFYKFCDFCENHPNMMKIVDEYLRVYYVPRAGKLIQCLYEDLYKAFITRESDSVGFAAILSKFMKMEHNIDLEVSSNEPVNYGYILCPIKDKYNTRDLLKSYFNELYDSSQMPYFTRYNKSFDDDNWDDDEFYFYN